MFHAELEIARAATGSALHLPPYWNPLEPHNHTSPLLLNVALTPCKPIPLHLHIVELPTIFFVYIIYILLF